MTARNIQQRPKNMERWPPVDRWPPADGDLLAERWQHPEDGLSSDSWSNEDNWLHLEGSGSGLNDDNLY